MSPLALVLCTVCYSDVAAQVRHAVLGADFAFNILVTAFPFVIFAGIVGWLYCGTSADPRRREP